MRVVLESDGAAPVFRATAGAAGVTVWVDAGSGGDGEPRGACPLELLAMGLGACLAGNVVAILKKKRTPFAGVRVEVEAERAAEPPGRCTALRLRVAVQSAALTPAALEKVLALSVRYCPAHAALSEGVPIALAGAVE